MRRVALVVLLVACSDKKSDTPAAQPPPAAKQPAPVTEHKKIQPKAPESADLGTCEVKVSGGVTAEWHGVGGTSSTAISYWFTPGDDNDKMMFGGKKGMIVNCVGHDGKLSFIGGEKVSKEELPFGPKKYTIEKGKRSFMVMATVGKDSMMGATGTLDIKELDSKHVTGSFDLDGKLLKGGDVKLTGTFDFKCPGYTACGK
ncbi:MAG TPA: hypothetical protein VFQ53_03960 [Kofleriaceae bacterium]|nr:hypothetical protein [Kofleriaceae bacterium]